MLGHKNDYAIIAMYLVVYTRCGAALHSSTSLVLSYYSLQMRVYSIVNDLLSDVMHFQTQIEHIKEINIL